MIAPYVSQWITDT